MRTTTEAPFAYDSDLQATDADFVPTVLPDTHNIASPDNVAIARVSEFDLQWERSFQKLRTFME
jgi:hypothetical protein